MSVVYTPPHTCTHIPHTTHTPHTHTQKHKHKHTQLAPEAIPDRVLLTTNQDSSTVSLDWSNSFHLNGILLHFTIERNNITLIQRPVTSYDFINQPTGTRKLIFHTFVMHKESCSNLSLIPKLMHIS